MTEPGASALRPGADAFEQVRLLIEARRPQDALTTAKEGLRLNPGDADLTAAVGWALMATGDSRAARSWAERSLELDPANAWVHNLRALTILNGAGEPIEAREAASGAVRQDPVNESYLYTLVRACLESGDRAGAEAAASAIRQTAPGSHLRPLSEALIELDRGRVYFRRKRSVVWLLVSLILTRGLVLVGLLIGWIIHVVRRAPHLRRADNLLNEALRIQPGAASIRKLASEVVRLRFRYAQSVDHQLATAAIDAGLVDANELATTIGRRTTGVIAVGWLLWMQIVNIANGLIDRDAAVAAFGLVLAIAVAIAILQFDRWQTRNLPPRLNQTIDRRRSATTVSAVAALLILLVGLGYLGGNIADPARGFNLACLVSCPVAVLVGVVFALRLIRSRPTKVPRSDALPDEPV